MTNVFFCKNKKSIIAIKAIINKNPIVKFCMFAILNNSIKRNAVIGIDKLSEPLLLIASAIVIARVHSIIAKKDSRVSF